MSASATESTRLRVVALGIIVLGLFSALGVRLWFLQVLTGSDYATAARGNAVRLIPIEAARGKILDRHGETLVGNRSSLVVSIRRDELPPAVEDREATLDRLAGILKLSRGQIEQRMTDKTVLPYAGIPIAKDVPESAIITILEQRGELPGVVTETRPVRAYPHGTLGAHILGYTGEIAADQLGRPRYRAYSRGSVIGRTGLEYAHERALHGRPGLLKLRVDSLGKVRGEALGRREPTVGSDLVTTIDLRIQALVEESLALGIVKARSIFDPVSRKPYQAPAGGAVVLDPRNAEILAMASYPAYDPNLFVGGISRADFQALNDDPTHPLLDRTIRGAFPPGSAFKVVTAAAALQEGIASPDGRYPCPPSFRFADRTWRNWQSSDSGAISVAQAIVESCDTVFYPFGAEFWRRFRQGGGEVLQRYARQFGFGAPTGIEIPFESAGRVPDERWLRRMSAKHPQDFPYRTWLPGYTVNISIGQGDVLATPLQLAGAYAAIANGGTLYRPHVGARVVGGRATVAKVAGSLDLSPATLGVIRQGLESVVTRGTAREAFAGFPFDAIPVAGKTGTAELASKQPYAWFVAYAPARDPRYVVAVMLEEGGHGGETAAPIARRVLEGLFDRPLSDITPAARTD